LDTILNAGFPETFPEYSPGSRTRIGKQGRAKRMASGSELRVFLARCHSPFF